jgi:hypothetical protein
VNGASLLLAAFKWILLVVWPARLPCEWASPVGGEQARDDSRLVPLPCGAEAKVGLGEGRGGEGRSGGERRGEGRGGEGCLLYTSPSPRDPVTSRMPSSA